MLPGLPKVAEKAVLRKLAKTYGKTWHFWQYDRGDKLPLGKGLHVACDTFLEFEDVLVSLASLQRSVLAKIPTDVVSTILFMGCSISRILSQNSVLDMFVTGSHPTLGTSRDNVLIQKKRNL